MILKRSPENPILLPTREHEWESYAAFNGSGVCDGKIFHFVYRAMSEPQMQHGSMVRLSSIGYAKSHDGIHFDGRRLFITPEKDWEIFGCEDPRITKFEGTHYIFYTALSVYPFAANGIRSAVAITKDFKRIEEKHLVTPFNSKAMALFPERINGKVAVVLTANTDLPPAKISLALLNDISELWSEQYWREWYATLDHHTIPLLRSINDHVEVGAPPLKTDDGWLLIYCYIKNYRTPFPIFGIEAVLLDLENPQKVVGRTSTPLLVSEESYERYGIIPNVIFPSGAIIQGDEIMVYYGSTDTTCSIATGSLSELIASMKRPSVAAPIQTAKKGMFKRFEGNPIIEPIPEHRWEARATFNTAAAYEGGKTHLLYRAMSDDNTSVLGYATTKDGSHIDERLPFPAYVPREAFEAKLVPGENSGCEDPRLTRIGDRLYMCYTAFDGRNPPRVALTSIGIDDFLSQHWNWDKPRLISPPGMDDKDACVFPKKINGKYIFLHRLHASIYFDMVDDLLFERDRWLGGTVLLDPRKGAWDNRKIGIAGPPIETPQGWLLIYHGVSEPGSIYKVGAALLTLDNPQRVLARCWEPLFEPELRYEKEGQVPNVVFSCGTVMRDDTIYMYYGGGDQVIGVAEAPISEILRCVTKDSA